MPSITYQANSQDGYISYIAVALPLPYETCRASTVANQHIDGATTDIYLSYGFYLMGEDALELFRSFPIFDINERLPSEAHITSIVLRQGAYNRPAADPITYIFIDPSQTYPLLPHNENNFNRELYPLLVAKHDPPSGSIKFLAESFSALESILKGSDMLKLCLRSGADVEGFAAYSSLVSRISSAENTNPPTLTVNYELEEPPPPPPTYVLSITCGSGGTTSPDVGSYDYSEGETVTVTATADSGYVFEYWLLDGLEVTLNPITVTMDADHVLDAVFREEEEDGEEPPPEDGEPPLILLFLVVGIILVVLALGLKGGKK